MKTTNHTVLITGGTSGIGLQLVRTFAGLGNAVIAVGRDEEKLAALKEELPGVSTFRCDLTKQADLDGLLLYVEQSHPELNVLINNAGIQYNYHFAAEPNLLARIDYEVATNLTATLKLCGLLLPLLLKSEEAAIVNVSSGLALSPKKSAPVYCATKAGIHNFSKALRYQLEATPVKVFEILPPVVDTPMTEGRGSKKISPQELVDEFMHDLKNNKYESYIGRTKLLRLVHRISPGLADKILKNG